MNLVVVYYLLPLLIALAPIRAGGAKSLDQAEMPVQKFLEATQLGLLDKVLEDSARGILDDPRALDPGSTVIATANPGVRMATNEEIARE